MTGQKGPYAIITACSQSHAFDERRVMVPCSEEEALKIGRSVARWKPSSDNAIFDCKVLSRNHALLWFEEGAFLLKDTKSSNGTFVNSERLSKSAEESSPRQIYSGDILQFGVDIVENANKVTHGCIVAMVRLFDCKGEEICPPESVAATRGLIEYGDSSLTIPPLINSHQLFQLQQYVREAAHREHILEQKLSALESVLRDTEQAAESSWQALINEDRLLSRIEMLEGQLALYSKNVLNDKVKEEMSMLLSDRNKFETLAKEAVRRAQEEKLEAMQRLADVERSLINTEEESIAQRERVKDLEKELANAVSTVASLTEKLRVAERQLKNAESAATNISAPVLFDEGNSVQKENEAPEFKEHPLDLVTALSDSDGKESDIDSTDANNLRSEIDRLMNENLTLKSQLEAYAQEITAPTAEKNVKDQTGEMLYCHSEGDFPVLILCALPLFAVFYWLFIIAPSLARISSIRPKCD